jgi:type VI secretion system secreted protein VgrG
MSDWYTQDKRIGVLSTPLGKDAFVLTSFEGTEGMSEPFEFRIEALHREGNVDLDQAIGQNCTVSIETLKHGKRYFVGVLTHSRLLRVSNEGYLHELVLRPWLWLLKHRVNSRIFHNKTVNDIVAKIFSDHGFAKYVDRTSNTYPELEYCVQHNESDFDFVSRLLEAHGISYRFTFEDGKHTMILGDGTTAYDPVPGSTREFYADTAYHERKEEHFYEWTPARQFTAGKVTVNDYDLHKPNNKLEGEKTPTPVVKFSPGDLEVYSHPYNAAVNKGIKEQDGIDYAKVLINMRRSEDGRFHATGDSPCVAPGLLLTMQKLFDDGLNVEYLILKCTHRFGVQTYRSGGGDLGTSTLYNVQCEVLKSDRPYAPPLATPRPVIAGPQTGRVVTKKPGENLEIDCDELGRVWVHFHWDRASADSEPEGRTMPCRVAQVWAGKKWGGIYIPRVGMEVLVHFIDGDPDRPIIVGTMYNGDEGGGNMPPYDLPDKKNIAGWKSQSTPQKPSGYNEIVMDDTAGNELMRVHAEYDLDSTVEHDERRLVKNDRTSTVKHDETTTINHDETRTVDNDRNSEVKNNDTLKVGNELTITAGTKITLKVGASSIVMDGSSIKINTIDLQTTGVTATHKGTAMMTIQGGVVKIN